MHQPSSKIDGGGIGMAPVRARGAGECLVTGGLVWDTGIAGDRRNRDAQDAVMRALAFGVRHGRHHRVPDNSEHQMEHGFHHWVRNDEMNTTKQESLKDSKLCEIDFPENQKHRRCSMK